MCAGTLGSHYEASWFGISLPLFVGFDLLPISKVIPNLPTKRRAPDP
ncbi:MAG: hypothetical protein ABI670_10445 [Chloroflexota bacterium]